MKSFLRAFLTNSSLVISPSPSRSMEARTSSTQEGNISSSSGMPAILVATKIQMRRTIRHQLAKMSKPEKSKDNLGDLIRIHDPSTVFIEGCEDPPKLIFSTLNSLYAFQLKLCNVDMCAFCSCDWRLPEETHRSWAPHSCPRQTHGRGSRLERHPAIAREMVIKSNMKKGYFVSFTYRKPHIDGHLHWEDELLLCDDSTWVCCVELLLGCKNFRLS